MTTFYGSCKILPFKTTVQGIGIIIDNSYIFRFAFNPCGQLDFLY